MPNTIEPIDEVLVLSEPELAEDWLKESEDDVWAHFQINKLKDRE